MPNDHHLDPSNNQMEKQSSDEKINDKDAGKDPDSLADGSGSTAKGSASDQGQEDGEESFSAG